MKKILFLFLVLPMFLAAPLCAVSYPPAAKEPPPQKDEEVMRAGVKVHLFHSGTADVRSAVRVNDVLVVYRELPPDLPGKPVEAGKVRIVAVLGDYYFEGELIEGYAEPGYLALKGPVACLITTRFTPKH